MRFVFFVAAALTGAAVLAAGVACSTGQAETPAPAPPLDDAANATDAADAATGLPYPLDQVCRPTNDPDADVCRACQHQHCCDSRARLFATDGGAALVACIAPTAADGAALPCDTDCIAGCIAAAPNDETHYLEHYACTFHHCPTECSQHPDEPDRCILCTEAECPQDSLACNRSRECFLLQTCAAACLRDATCVSACAARYPAGEKVRQRILLCATNRCAKECPAE